MKFFHLVYTSLATGVGLILLPPIWWSAQNHPKRRAMLAQRLGYGDANGQSEFKGRPRIWMHAVSVGEVKVAEAVIRALDAGGQHIPILLTTTTTTGQRYALKILGQRVTLRYAPLDLWGATGRFLGTYRPDLLVCIETEIWPNWIFRAHRAGIRTIFLNGRVSDRSIRSYLTIRPLLRPVLEKVAAFSMISKADARRIMALGAPAKRVEVNGNAKMDARWVDVDKTAAINLRRQFALEPTTPTFVAGSIRGAEVEPLLDVYGRLAARIPGLVFIIAPRHIEKSSRIASLAQARGLQWQRRTEMGQSGECRQKSMIILDTIGELRHVYSLATVVFCGASLVQLGGQNILEPAMWAKPVLYGPFMDDFAEARRVLEQYGGGICVNDPDELADRAGDLLEHPETARRIGRQARAAVLSVWGAAERHARMLCRFL